MDVEGDIWEMALPNKISVHNCPESVIKYFLSRSAIMFVPVNRGGGIVQEG
jgi:hypothetical protein